MNRKVHLDRGNGTPWCFVKAKAYSFGNDVTSNCEICFKQREGAPGPSQRLSCGKCGKTKSGAEFPKDATRASGRASACGECYRKKKREEHKRHPGCNSYHALKHRLNNPQMYRDNARLNRQRHPKAAYARDVIRNEVKRGRLQRGPCETCGKKRAHGHHDDYDRPLEVRWLCPTHHRYWHEENGPGANIEGAPVHVSNYRQRKGLK